MEQGYKVQMQLEQANGMMAFHIRVFGDHLAKREGYTTHRDIDAVHYYLVQKHGWLPSVVRSLSVDDLHFLLTEEMRDWSLPEEAK